MGYLKGILFFLFTLWIVNACSETDPVVPVEEVTEVEMSLPTVKTEILEINQRDIKLKITLSEGKYTKLTGLKLCYAEGTLSPDTTHNTIDIFLLYEKSSGSIILPLEKLKAATEYSYRLHLENEKVSEYSKIQNFITKSPISKSSWEFVTDLPGTENYLPLVFAVQDKIFAGITYFSWNGIEGGEFWGYDFSSKNWIPKKETPWGKRAGLTFIPHENKAYMGLGDQWYVPEGYPRYYEKMRDWWAYDPETDEWIQKADIPYEYWYVMTSFVYNEYIYIIYSQSLMESIQEPMYVMAYNTKTDKWIQKKGFPGERVQYAGSFVLNDKAYLICGETLPGYSTNPMGYTTNVWEYDLRNDTWEQKADFPGGERSGVIAEASNGTGYAGFGEKYATNTPLSVYCPIDWWSYSPEEDQWYPCNTHNSWDWFNVNFSFVINDEIYIGSTNNGLWKYIDE